MTEGLIGLAAGCLLLVSETEVAPRESGWLESTAIEVVSDGDCTAVDLALPPGVHLGAHKGKVKFSDGVGHKVTPERWEIRPRSLQDAGSVRVHLPELLGGDRVHLQFERVWTRTDPFIWAPGQDGTNYAEIQAPASLDWATEGLSCSAGKGECWASPPAPEATLTLSGPQSAAWTSPFADLLPPSRPVQHSRRLVLQVPEGDPQVVLYPGGGASRRMEESLAFAAEDRRRGYLVPVPAERTEVSVSIEPRGAATYLVREDGVVLDLPPTEGPVKAMVVWEAPDVPTHGEIEPGESLEVSARGGVVLWEDDRTWWLAGIHERGVLPGREPLIKALDYRFRAMSIPEPGLPNELRGRVAGWELAGELRTTLSERAMPATWPHDPLWTRKLVTARKSGAITETEAALILWLYARQGGLGSQWALVRPATAGAGHEVSPAGYDHALVRLEWEGEHRWVDPGCMVCAPFEVRPELEGAAAISPAVTRTGEPTPGTWHAEIGADGIRWKLTGTAALRLRLWLDGIPGSERREALAARIAGPGAELVTAEGVDEAGAPITATAKIGQGIHADPLALPVPRTDATAWLDWIGERSIHWAGRQGADAAYEGEALSYRRQMEGGDLVEVLTVRDRLVSAAELAAFDAARASGAEPDDSAADAPPDSEPEADPAAPHGEEQHPRGVDPVLGGDAGGIPPHEGEVEEGEQPQ